MIMNSSRQSIVPILVSMLVTCVAGLFFYCRKSRGKMCDYWFVGDQVKNPQ